MSDPEFQVLLVDDDEALRDLLRVFFQQRNIEFSVLHDAMQLERRLQRERPSVIVLDVMMPGVDGLTALKELRGRGDRIPVVMLTARADGTDRVVGLELGADDYLGKPFMPQELLARIRAVLRRQGDPDRGAPVERRAPCRFGPFELNFATRTLLRDGEPIKLTGSEYAMLEVFALHPMETLSRSRLLDLLHGPGAEVTERGIDVPVWRLRRLIEVDPSNPRRLQTMRGVGYMFVPDEDADNDADKDSHETDV
ncbi:response regulator [Paraburkholderia bannensis]|uniref:response regulator n=1 Tax=Paraburkholderia bannensis TaxID=765414 RepID=UPI002AB1AA40|nr:response regulator [Paraburkholderia bannensis]